MHSSFSKIFWGLLIAGFDFRINDIDILPDFIGYLLLALGCSGLRDESGHFSTAQLLAWLLFFFSLVMLPFGKAWPVLLSSTMTLLDAVMIWLLLSGLRDFCFARDSAKLAEKAAKYRIIYILVTFFFLLIEMGAFIPNPAILFLFIVISFIRLFLILYLIKRVQADLIEENA